MKQNGFWLILMLCSLSLQAQQDSILQVLKTVDVSTQKKSSAHTSVSPVQILTKEQIGSLPALQLSDVLKLFSGVVIKDYGGTGGLKTVSVRGFGAQHTAVAYDNIAMSDCQTGQIDFGKLSLENLEILSLSSGVGDDIFIPARLFASASLISLKSKLPVFDTLKPVNLFVSCAAGSFGLFNPIVRIENKLKKKKSEDTGYIYSSVTVNFLHSQGNYPYTIFYGDKSDSTSRERRQNSDITSISGEGNLYAGFRNNGDLRIRLFYYHSEHGLPGAVIFYNPYSSQRLWDDNAMLQLHYRQSLLWWLEYQLNTKYNYAYQHYIDPEYLNSAGKLDNQYKQQEGYISNTFLFKPLQRFSGSFSHDLLLNTMDANLTDFASPLRFTSLTLLMARYKDRYVSIEGGLLHTFISDHLQTEPANKTFHRFSPSLGMILKPIHSKEFRIRFFYKNIFRMPTFNDLYYQDVGNRSLKPENTDQLDVGMTYERRFAKNKIHFSLIGDLYYNRVKDKIVTVPNKNLFIWSMINYGKVEILGVEGGVFFSWQIIPKLKAELSGNYTFQQVVDITNPNSKTYFHQLPYTPLHSGTLSVIFRTCWVDFVYTVLMTGERYTLPQNSINNRLSPYTDQSIAMQHDFKIKKVILGVKVELLNITNTQYEIIHNFPMQGRSIRCRLSCSF
jgi:hypothetical protein